MSGWPCALPVSSVAAMLNVEFADDPVYSAIELQWFDDDEHGTGMLAFFTRKDTDQVDCYCQPNCRRTLDDCDRRSSPYQRYLVR